MVIYLLIILDGHRHGEVELSLLFVVDKNFSIVTNYPVT
jgi:hypothetical protein